MPERIIDYVPVSKLGRGYAGKIIDEMKEKDSVVYILRNNNPEAVLLKMEDYQNLLNGQSSNRIRDRKRIVDNLAGCFHEYADPDKISGERKYYQKALIEKHAN